MTAPTISQVIQQATQDNLTTLNLSRMKLTALPAEIVQLQSLNYLDLSHNCLTTLPSEIKNLSNLRRLDLRSNYLTTLPTEIGDLASLIELYLAGNQLTELPEAIGKLVRLQVLDLYRSRLTTLPSEMRQLVNLKVLDLSNNCLKSLPPELGELINLKELYLYNNELTTVPAKIGQLIQLSRLDLSNNQLTTLPAEIGCLTNLKELYLYDNKLTILPQEMQQLTNLESLDLKNNALSIPLEILGLFEFPDDPGDPFAVLNYYFQLQQNQQKPLNEAKLLLVGQGSVGKTSLVNRLIENHYDPHEPKTEGINIQNWQVQIHQQTVRLNVWDFGGQEIMHATHQFFLTKRSLYLLVLDARLGEEENRLEYWLKIIQSFGDDSPVIIVGNKIDQHPLDINQQGLRNKYTNIQEIVEVSCETGYGLDRLQTIITREIGKLKHIYDPLPLAWFDVKTRLEQTGRDYIPYSDYKTLCYEEDIDDDLSQATLIELLHQLGIILSFRDDPRLEDTHVLNPEWVTAGVYQILNDNLLMTEYRGILDRIQLNRILDTARYPRSKQLFIVDIMRKFELCFPLEGSINEQFLIPDLLPKEEPATGDWETALEFQYHYNVLPSSIISRFIVRMHHLADKRTWWRSGIVLKHRNNRALVKADREDEKIFIWIGGPHATRRELLAMIRSQFDAIHQTIKGLVAEEKMPLPDCSDIVVDYQHLLNLEELGEDSFIPSGLREKVNVKQLLDGIESEQERVRRQYGDRSIYEAFHPMPVAVHINPDKEVFISYAWRGESEAFVNQLCDAFQTRGIRIVRDKKALGFKGLIKEFMERIGDGKCVISVISDRYLKSPNCMFELIQVANHGNFHDRIFPIILNDAKIYNPVDRADYVIYWEEEIQTLIKKIQMLSSPANVPSLRRAIDEYTKIRETIDSLNDILQNMNTLTPDIHNQSDFEELFDAVECRLKM